MYEEEQVLISCRGAYSGKINWSPKQSFITNNSLILEIADQQLITKKYLFFSLTNVDKSNLITGSAQPQVTINNAVDLPIPLPPLHMQQRIVAEIEKQFSRLDEAVTNLKRVKANLKRYRASVLKAAVEGRLVETEAEVARREGREYESGKQLLERILETRRRDWKGKGQYKEPAAPDVSKLPELPEGWAWGTVEQMADKITDGEHISPKTLPAGVPMLSAKDVRENEILFEEPKYVSPAEAKKFRERCDPCRDDILIVSRGATVGRACKVTTDQLFCLMGSVILLRITKLCLAEFVLCSLKAGFFLKRLIGVSGSTAQQAVYIRDIRALILPLPPLAEQKRIVAEVDRRLSLVRETEAQVEANLKRAERLRQSVLQKAFSGELVRDEAG
jgi:type I restriction enzyme S subunit